MKIGIYFFTLIGFQLFTNCGSSNNDSTALPVVSSPDVSQNRPTSDTDFEFVISIPKASTSDVAVDYATVNGTAIAGTDFVSTTGTAIIPAGSLLASFHVKVIRDSLRKDSQYFLVTLSNPKNCTIQSSSVTCTIINADGLYFPVDNTGYNSPLSYSGYVLKWNDEFDGKSIDGSSWLFETGGGGWGNNELENYTQRTQNAFVSEGNLIIEARAEKYGTYNFTSARMITKSMRTFTYGRVDIRAKVPTGKGIWPALWMLGQNIGQVGWPACGEIDIMELIGSNPNTVYGTLHWGASAATHQHYGTNYSLVSGIYNDEFHVFSMVWTATTITMFIDDNLYFTRDITGLPFDKDFFFIFNVAVGGDWPGSPDNTTQFPQRMVVDYIRVFQ